MERWIIPFIVFGIIAIVIYGIKAYVDIYNQEQIKSNQNNLRENQDYIINALNNSEEQRQEVKISILNNLSNKIDVNTHYLATIIKALNITDKNFTIVINDTDPESGKISGIGKSIIVN